MSCAFTDATSTHYGTSRSDCRGCRKPKVQILCGYCEPGVDVSRCSSCYQKFASTIAKRIPDLEQKTNGKVFMQPALSALLTEAFDEIGSDRRARKARRVRREGERRRLAVA